MMSEFEQWFSNIGIGENFRVTCQQAWIAATRAASANLPNPDTEDNGFIDCDVDDKAKATIDGKVWNFSLVALKFQFDEWRAAFEGDSVGKVIPGTHKPIDNAYISKQVCSKLGEFISKELDIRVTHAVAWKLMWTIETKFLDWQKKTWPVEDEKSPTLQNLDTGSDTMEGPTLKDLEN